MNQPHDSRIELVRKKFKDLEIDGLLVLIEENRRYLSGFTGEDNGVAESAGALVIGLQDLILLTDGRYTTQASAESPLYRIVVYKKGLESVIAGLLTETGISCLGIEAPRVTLSQHAKLNKSLLEADGNASLKPVEDVVQEIRAVKDEHEIQQTRKVLAIAETAFQKTLAAMAPGMTEKSVAWMLERNMREGGAESLAFPVIVASGPNSALPHAVPGDRKINQGEPIIIDWGARLGGYCSDTTRTVILGTPDDRFRSVFKTVLSAHRRVCEQIRSGAGGTRLDGIAREWIDNNGYKGRFEHSLGHGTGLAVHELPHLSPVRDNVLESGMIVTVEPGIYIPDWGGVRLENQVVVRENGAEILNTLDLEINCQ